MAGRKSDEPPHAGTGGGQTAGMGNMGGLDRPDRGPYGGWVTPNYSWDQAKLSDFGLLGAGMNMIGGVLKGNTYSGRTPHGFTTGQSRDLGALGPKAQGNTGDKTAAMLMAGSTAFPGSSGRAAAGIGLQEWNRMIAAQKPKPATPAAPAGPNLTLSTVPAATLGGPIPGLGDYTLNLPAYQYYGAPGQVRPAFSPQAIAALLKIARGGPGYETGMIRGGVK